MSRRAAALAAALGLLAAFVPRGAGATDGYGCGGAWSSARECRVRLQGLPITVYGTALGSGAWIHVRLDIPTVADVTILECSATDASDGTVDGLAECSGFLVVNQDVVVPAPEGTVRCRVEGKTSGPFVADYFCRTGSQGLPV
jgi:hypothetical protein